MKLLKILLYKELRQVFSGSMIYIFLAIFSFISGGLFFGNLISLNEVTNKNIIDNVLSPTFSAVNFLLIFFTPVLTMRNFVDEKKSETLNLLLLSNLSSTHIFLGKYISSLIQGLFIISTIFLFPIILAFSGFSDWGMVFSYILGLYMMFSIYACVGTFCSLVSKNAITSIVICFAILFSFMILFTTAAMIDNLMISQIIQYFSFGGHIYYFSRGAIASFDIIYMFSFILFFSYTSIQVLEVKR